MEDETSDWSDALDKEKGVVFIDLPLTMTIDRYLSALNSRPAQVRAVTHQERTLACSEYSSMMFIPASKKIVERVQPAKIPC